MAQAPVSLESLLVSREGYRGGRPCLRGTGITVHQVAIAHQMGLSPKEICEQNPDLDPSLFFAALAYYFANQAQIDAEIDADDREAEEMAAKYPNGMTRESLGL